MSIGNMIFYTVAGGIIWFVAQALGADLTLTLAASFLVPPLLIIALILYRSSRNPY